MVGLYLKDILFFRKYWLKVKYILSFVLVLIVAIFFLKEESIIISIFINMLILNSIQIFFTDDIKSGWIEFLNATDLTPFKIVLSRFLSSFTIVLFSNIISFVINSILYFSFNSFSIKEYLLIALIASSVSIIYIIILLPLIYLFDQNGLTIAVILLFIITFFTLKMNNFIITISYFLQNSSYIKLGFVFVLGISILGLISFLISQGVYKWRFITR